MEVTVKKLPRGQVEIQIGLSVEEYQPYLQQAAQAISQQTSIPGFRPGKADYESVKQRVGEGKVWEEALEPAIRKTLVNAINQEKLITVGSPHIDVEKLAPGNPVSYKATLSLLPEVTLGDLTKISIAAKPATVPAAEFEKAMENLRKMRHSEALVDRPAKTGDKVEIDFEVFRDNVPIEHGKSEKFPIVIGEATFIPGFEEQLVGLKSDETKEFDLTFPDQYHNTSLAGQPVTFKVKVQSVFELTLPELTDDFAKGFGLDSIKTLEDRVRQDLTTEAERREQGRVEDEMLDKIVSACKFGEIPDLLIGSEVKKMVSELEQNLSQQGIKIDDYLLHLKKDRQQLMLDFTPQAIQRIKTALIMRKISSDRAITITAQEIDKEVQSAMETYGESQEIKDRIKTPDYRQYVANILTSRKVIDQLKAELIK